MIDGQKRLGINTVNEGWLHATCSETVSIADGKQNLQEQMSVPRYEPLCDGSGSQKLARLWLCTSALEPGHNVTNR
jgi:hypothetical protein